MTNTVDTGALIFGEDANGSPEPIKITAGEGHVTQTGAPDATETRIARFAIAADMPADITDVVDVTADKIQYDTFSSAARKVQLIWHGLASESEGGTNSIGPAALGARIVINATDDAAENTTLTYVVLTGGGTSSSGKSGLMMVSPSEPFIEIKLDAALTRIALIGIPVTGKGTPVFEACFLEMRIIG